MREAAQYLKTITPFFNLWDLAGNSKKEHRREFIRLATGEKRPLAKCGINAMMDVLNDHFKPNPGCLAFQEKEIILGLEDLTK